MKRRLARLVAGTLLAAAVGPAWSFDEPDTAPIRFDISRFAVSGNTLLSAAEVDAAVAPFTGSGRDFAAVQEALEALEAAYHRRGYQMVTVQLPEQELNRGEVQFTVVQTKIGQINVSGNKFVDQDNVRRSLPTLRAGETPDLLAVSANLKLANENPARKINLKLQGTAAGDAVDANLEVADEKPWKVMLNVDNTGTEQTGKTHVGVVLQHANLWGRDHVGSFQYTTTAEEPGKVSVYGVGYHIPLYTMGDSIDLYASYSDVDTGTVTAGIFDLAVSGKGTVAGMRYNQLLKRRGNFEPRLVYGIDHKAYKNSLLFAGENFGSDITVHPLSVAFVGTSTLGGGEANMALTYVRNVPGGSRGARADFERARMQAKAGYQMLRYAAAFNRSVGEDWAMRLLLNGQLSADALVPGEQFGAGGAASVRGFSERALSTDSGALANVELFTPNLCKVAGWQCRLLAFYDTAYGKRNKALPGELVSTSIASTGVGLRMGMGNSLSVQLDYGHVLRDGGTANGDKNKLHVRVGLAY